MNYSLILDSVACLPMSEIARRRIEIIPLTIIIHGKRYIDTYEQDTLVGLHRSGLINVQTKAKTISSTESEISRYLTEDIIPNYDVVLCQTLGKAYSPIYENYRSVTFKVAQSAHEMRRDLGIDRPFQMTCMSSSALAAGQGLLALYSDDLMSSGESYNRVKEQIETFKSNIMSFTVVKDPIYTREHAKSKGNETVSYPVAWLADKLDFAPIGNNQNEEVIVIDVKHRGFESSANRVLNYCSEQVVAGLKTPYVNVSYAGDPEVIRGFEGFQALARTCAQYAVTLLLSPMTMGASINLGPGSLSIGIAPENQESKP